MPTLSQVSTQQVPVLGAGVDPTSAEYAKNRVQQFQTQTQPAFGEGLRSLRSYIRSSRGLGDSGIEASQVAGLAQSRDRQIGDYATQVGKEQSDLSQRNKEREQARKWQLEDQSFQERQNTIAADRAKQEAQDRMWGSILGGAAGLAGNVLFPALRGANATTAPVPVPKVSDPTPPPSIYDGSIMEGYK
jgi:hypothetical protein